MPPNSPLRSVLVFCLGLLILVPLCLVLWGELLPYYADALGQISGMILRVLGHPIESVRVAPAGMVNTRTQLAFTLPGHSPAMDVGALVFNIPPFVALMAITPGLKPRRRLIALIIGVAILAVGHLLYIVLAFAFARRIAESPQIPSALSELFLTLPFLLWLLLGYWDKIAPHFAKQN